MIVEKPTPNTTSASKPKTIAKNIVSKPLMETTPKLNKSTSQTMRLALDIRPSDILANLDQIQPQITFMQLLAIAPKCRNELCHSMVRKHNKDIEIHDISLDPRAPIV